MKKKWLIGIASCIMVAAFSFGLAACGDNGKDDAIVAQKAIDTLNIMYSGDNESTPSDYKVVGQVTAEGTQCAVKWTITSDVENYSNYVSVSEEMDSESKYTVHITRTTVDVPYKLNASVTVGSETKTTSFNHKVPLTQNAGVDTVNATLDFTDANSYTRNESNQVWESNGLKLDNNSAQTANYTNPARFYKNTKVSIAFTDTTIGILHLDFHCHQGYSDSPYSTWLDTDLKAQFPEATVTLDAENYIVGIQLKEAVSVFEFTCSSGQIRLYSIDVEGTKISDETIIAGAKASLELEQETYFIQDTATLPTEYNGATIAWALKETSTYASVSGNTLTISSLPTEGTATVTLVATISAGSATPDTKELTVTLKPTPALTGEGTATSPYTAADAHKIAALVDAGNYYSKAGEPQLVQVKGYVIEFSGWSSDYNNWTAVYIAVNDTDAKDSDNAIQIYRLTLDNTYLKAEADLVKGAELTVQGYLQNYNGTLEITYLGSTNPTATAYQDGRTQEERDIDSALAGLEDTLTVTETGSIDLPASTVEGVTFTWSTENETYTIAGNKLTVNELPASPVTFDATVTAKAGEGATEKTGTKTVHITVKPAASGTEKVLELTPSNFNSTDDGLEKSGLETNTSYSSEFNISPNGYIKSNTLGRVSKIEAEIYGTYDNMKMYAAYTADTAKQVTGTKTTPQSNHQLFTYTFEGGTTEFYFVNPSTFTVNAFWIKIYYVEAGGGSDVGGDDEVATEFSLTVDTLTIPSQAYTNSGNATIGGIQFNWVGMGNFGNGLQMRTNDTTGTSSFWNNEAFGKNIQQVTLTWSSKQSVNTKSNLLKVEFADNVEFTDAKSVLVTFEESTYNVAIPGEYKFVRITHNGSNTVYLDKVDIVCGDEAIHNHDYKCVKDSSTTPWEHKLHCDVAGCPEPDITEACEPVLNVCECGRTYTQEEIIAKLFGLTEAGDLKGTYVLEGTVKAAVEVGGSGDWKFDITVDTDKTVQAYYVKHAGFRSFPEVGATVKVSGPLKLFVSGNNKTYEFNGGNLVEINGQTSEPADPNVVYSLNSDEQVAGKNSSYGGNGDVEVNKVTWNVEGNTNELPWRFGGKSITSTERKLTGKTAITGTVAQILLQFTDSGSITINSVTLKVYSNDPTADGATVVDTKEITYKKGENIIVTPSDGVEWTDCYYQIIFNVTVSGSSNKYVSILRLEFSKAPAAAANLEIPEAILPGDEH